MCAACVGLNWTDEVGKLQKRACSALRRAYGGKYTLKINMLENVLVLSVVVKYFRLMSGYF